MLNNRLLKDSPTAFHAPVLTKEIQEQRLPTVYIFLAVHILLRRKRFSKEHNDNLHPNKANSPISLWRKGSEQAGTNKRPTLGTYSEYADGQ
jgi:hypothetical protein